MESLSERSREYAQPSTEGSAPEGWIAPAQEAQQINARRAQREDAEALRGLRAL